MRSVSRLADVSINTVSKLLVDTGNRPRRQADRPYAGRDHPRVRDAQRNGRAVLRS